MTCSSFKHIIKSKYLQHLSGALFNTKLNDFHTFYTLAYHNRELIWLIVSNCFSLHRLTKCILLLVVKRTDPDLRFMNEYRKYPTSEALKPVCTLF